jgi:hypothetical protein
MSDYLGLLRMIREMPNRTLRDWRARWAMLRAGVRALRS